MAKKTTSSTAAKRAAAKKASQKKTSKSKASESKTAKSKKSLSYRAAGVDIEAGNEVVRRIGPIVKRTHGPEVLKNQAGGFGGLFSIGSLLPSYKDPVLVGATDGVGTKLKIAFLTGRFDTVGIDLVAMCVNDLVVGGAKPLFFLDYVATAQVKPQQLVEVVSGIAEGCNRAACALIGGETAELPGFYQKGEFDLAGFAVGMVDRGRIIDGSKVRPGDTIVGLPSSGLHSNGFSLARKALLPRATSKAMNTHIDEFGRTLGEELLEPTKIYTQSLVKLFESFRRKRPIRALAHITGGGLVENIPRILPDNCDARIQRKSWDVPPVFKRIKKLGQVTQREMDRVFNQGIGMVLIVASDNLRRVLSTLEESGEKPVVIGEVTEGKGKVRFS